LGATVTADEEADAEGEREVGAVLEAEGLLDAVAEADSLALAEADADGLAELASATGPARLCTTLPASRTPASSR
jgi:hypothetical protein